MNRHLMRVLATAMRYGPVDRIAPLTALHTFRAAVASVPAYRDLLTKLREAHPEIIFRFRHGTDLPVIELDRKGMKRAVRNLLDNAVGACSAVPWAGCIDIATTHDPDRDVVVLELADNGGGMSPAVKARLFEPYFSTKKGGTGLGLVIVSDVVADHKGFIRVHDNHPSGTRLVIELPAQTQRVLAVARMGAGGRG